MTPKPGSPPDNARAEELLDPLIDDGTLRFYRLSDNGLGLYMAELHGTDSHPEVGFGATYQEAAEKVVEQWEWWESWKTRLEEMERRG